jgi:RNA polymerase-binding transcription factor DksA
MDNIVEKAKILLEKEKENLEKELQGFAVKNRHRKGDWETRFPSFHGSSLEEEADEVEEYGNLLPIERALEKKLVEVNEALAKIKEGKYGICEKCRQPVSQERLEAIPETKICDKCKK